VIRNLGNILNGLLNKIDMEEKRMKINIELHVVGDGRTFLNFWNHKNGEDVVAELIDGKLYQDENGVLSEISLQKFVDDVKERVSKW
jgi:hypothetical protein